MRTPLLVASLACAALLCALAACLPSPEVTVVTRTVDAAADVGATTPCRACIENPDDAGPGCADEVQACFADPGCQAALECSFARGCFALGSTEQTVQCGVPCAVEAGLTVGTDKGITLGASVYLCATTTCASACGIDAGS